MGRRVDMRGALQVGNSLVLSFVQVRLLVSPSELLAPEELLPYLLHPDVANLDPDTIAVYLQAANKIFGYWATEAAQQWTDDLLDKVKAAVDSIMEQIEEFVSSPHIEVQERVRMVHLVLIIKFNCLYQAANILQLFTFIKRDLAAHRPQSDTTFTDTSAPVTVFDAPSVTSGPNFPKSLYLIYPLCSAYELNPVALAAQASVPVPDGLDLDAWIVPSMQAPLPDEDESGEVADEKKVKKSKKGKEKEKDGRTRSKGTKKRKEDEIIEELIPREEVETPEEIAERERVSRACPHHCQRFKPYASGRRKD